ncbi:uncharacterized protein BX664DRAFT_354560 [Halteromyces radiatus]|uniref:uncharacterized protein n=1 Tax=Halteromyces radiatus TaxID=101107 RepID=UPI0022207A4E|nr:uncharacterized protein BX664DRAFT_354560 [Halteromyces radiatus]KAI8099082.1 hypothetical protein BX664DRAFT_354560 [Halteromyces radiatus]
MLSILVKSLCVSSLFVFMAEAKWCWCANVGTPTTWSSESFAKSACTKAELQWQTATIGWDGCDVGDTTTEAGKSNMQKYLQQCGAPPLTYEISLDYNTGLSEC